MIVVVVLIETTGLLFNGPDPFSYFVRCGGSYLNAAAIMMSASKNEAVFVVAPFPGISRWSRSRTLN